MSEDLLRYDGLVVHTPAWKGVVSTLIDAASHRALLADESEQVLGEVLRELRQYGEVEGFDDVQRQLSDRKSCLQLVALPVEGLVEDDPALACIDPLTGEERGHFLVVTDARNGHRASAYLAALGISHRQNIQALAFDTGFLIPKILE